LQKENFTEYIELLSDIMRHRKLGEVPKAYIRTYGCQQNVADSERIKGMLSLAGFEFSDVPEKADLILFNTCAVREHAEDRVFGNVGALKNIKQRYPSVTIALCGCMMEQEHIADKIYKTFPFVNIVFGTHSLHKFLKLYYDYLTKEKRIFKKDNDDLLVHEGIPSKRNSTFKGFLPIMYGCDNFCSYCIVPHVRGRERSRQSGDILSEAKKMIADGYKDITLLGQNVNSYGKGLEENICFADLIQKIDLIEGEYWLRFMTSHPKDCTKALIDVISKSKHVSKHIHLPVQSGSNKVLKAMNRKYTREHYLETISYIKEKIPDVCLTSDVIVGFPGETYEDFKETVSLLKEVKFTSLFTFIFSKRKGTKAAEMYENVSHETKTKWFEELLDEQTKISAEISRACIGKNFKILAESETAKSGIMFGKTSGNVRVEFQGDKELIGTFQYVVIADAGNWVLKGKLV